MSYRHVSRFAASRRSPLLLVALAAAALSLADVAAQESGRAGEGAATPHGHGPSPSAGKPVSLLVRAGRREPVGSRSTGRRGGEPSGPWGPARRIQGLPGGPAPAVPDGAVRIALETTRRTTRRWRRSGWGGTTRRCWCCRCWRHGRSTARSRTGAAAHGRRRAGAEEVGTGRRRHWRSSRKRSSPLPVPCGCNARGSRKALAIPNMH